MTHVGYWKYEIGRQEGRGGEMKWLGIGVYGLVCLAAIVLGVAVGVGISLSLTIWLFDQLLFKLIL